MSTAASPRKLVLVVRRTRLQELVQRHNSVAQARFYVEHLGADFGDYVAEHETYQASLASVHTVLQDWGRYQVVERTLLPNVVFGPDDLVIALGQDGLVANTLKYLDGQPLVGVNPDPARWDGRLLPFGPADLPRLLPEAAAGHRPVQAVTMAEARLSDGQQLLAVNDLFIGARSHVSALYDITHGGCEERHSSSGVIVSTGLGASGWMRSVLTGARRVTLSAAGMAVAGQEVFQTMPDADTARADWGRPRLQFAVREPFPSRTTQATLVWGMVTPAEPLLLRSRMAEGGVIFSDGMEADFLRFGAGVTATVGLAARQGALVV